MPFLELTHDEMRHALGELDQALFHHEQWCEELNRTLICRLTPDRRDTVKDAFRHCRFGQWLYGKGSGTLARHPGFAEIEAAHSRMHVFACDLLNASADHKPISIAEYEKFTNALKQMRLEVLTTKHELEDAIYNVDPLTGATSRIGLLTKLREQQALVQRKAHFCCLAMMDFDHFKRVNDTHGHATGDRVLATIVRMLRSKLRPFDLLFRFGGEEFLICAVNADLKTGQELVERLRTEIAALQFENSGVSFGITASFGLTLLDPDVTVEQSIDRADKALYAAKGAGRNCTVIWDPSLG